MKRICKECGQEFELTSGEINFYNSKNLELPKRCKKCRENSKTEVTSENMENIKSESINENTPINIRGTKNKFITAIVLFICIIATLSGKQFLDTGVENNDNTSYESESNTSVTPTYQFRSDRYLTEHFEKHGSDFDYSTKEEYLAGANNVISSSDALHKTEKEDGDDVYYLEKTNEFVIVSTDGYIRTYFKPESGIKYYNRQ